MAQRSISKSEVLERVGERTFTQVIFATILFLGLLLAVYLCSFVDKFSTRVTLQILLGAGALAAFVWAIMAFLRVQQARTSPYVTQNCPYCDFPMQFQEQPVDDYDCEGCHRRVYYENGRPVEIKKITCAFCKTVHKVSAKARTFTCDRCNRMLQLTDKPGATPVPDRSDLLMNYDVLLTDVGRQKNEVAMALQSILVCNLPEARRQMEKLPLTVMRNVPERKADAVRRRLRELGATAIVKPTETEQPAGRR